MSLRDELASILREADGCWEGESCCWESLDAILASGLLDRLRAEGYMARVQQEQGDLGLRCWCGAEVGPRSPGDANGLGCLRDLHHAWR